MSGTEVTRILVAGMGLPAVEHLELVNQAIDEIQARPRAKTPGLPRLFIWGSEIDDEAFIRLAEGAHPEDLLAGVHRAMAAKVAMLAKRLKMEPEVVLTGGGAEDAGLVRAVSEALGLEVRVPENPRLTAALGAACLAEEDQPVFNLTGLIRIDRILFPGRNAGTKLSPRNIFGR